jgi:hypothetical protein
VQLLIAVISALLPPVAASAACIGDCPPSDGQVAVNELVLGVSIALGSAGLDTCPGFDADDSGTVAVDELVSAVNNAQLGCGGSGLTPTITPPTGEASPTPSRTPTVGGTPATSPTATWTIAPGPTITFFGVTSADDSLQEPSATDPQGIAIYERPFGFGFKLVVETHGEFLSSPRPSGYAIGAPPELQVQATNSLGDGSAAVCDGASPTFGGIPGIDPPDLGPPEEIADALNDFGCRFVDGRGTAAGRNCAEACVRYDDGDYHCVENDTDYQFCAPIDAPMEFPSGDTLITVRVLDRDGQLGPPAQLIVRVP